MPGNDVVLSVQDLSVNYLTPRGQLQAVNHVSFDLHKRETLAIMGESGCGKSTLNLALIRLLASNATIPNGKIIYSSRDGSKIDVLKLSQNGLRRFRWSECSMVFQGALNALNPVIRIRDMFYDTARAHGERNQRRVRAHALELFRKVRLDPQRVFDAYPHELSGGMRQRVLIALGLLLDPQVVILDEPTTAVDILTQRTIIDVLKALRDELGFSILFISHDLSVAAEMADTVATMYAGEIVEIGPVGQMFYRPRHAYTLGLLEAIPRLSAGAEELMSIPGSPPDLIEPPSGCKFHIRCPFATEQCAASVPPTEQVGANHLAACFEAEKVLARASETVGV
ncbi:ABC transporter ATP-binding protein [Aggregatilinea lenta]|uniref:ABC transporter ATP-binding protein n=1 Tax=Aggregatilinea lenta TaxID=913108 RepID=UPI000E5C18C9|nr:ABC transporter ATP-binding protein [Aggregatilinea lenta]